MAKKTKSAGLSIEEKLEQALIVPGYESYQLPENWCWVRIDSISSVYTGNSINEQVKTEKYTGRITGLIYLATKDIGFDSSIDYDTNVRIPKEEGFKIAPKGTTLLCIEGGSAGRKIGIVEQDVCFVNKLCAFVPYKGILPKYLFYAIQSNFFKKQFDAKKHGLIGGVSLKDVSSIYFPLAPLQHQSLIVEHIESLFSKLDEAKEKAQAVIDSFETRKAAILHKAFSGELTAKWREENGVGIDSWEKCSLIDILIEKPRNGYSPKPVDYPTNVKSMTLSATTSGVFMPQYFKYIDEQISADSYLWLKKGDILIQRANSLDKVGTSAIYTGEDNEFIYPDLIMKLRVINKVSSHFIAYQLKTQKSIQYFRSNATGTAGNMPKINQKVVSATPIMLPTHAEQIELVRILDDLFSKETKEERNAKKVTDQIEKMKRQFFPVHSVASWGRMLPARKARWNCLNRFYREILTRNQSRNPNASAL